MRTPLAAALLVAAASAHAVPGVGWIRASGQLASDVPGRYSALNLLDGVSSTVWCSRGADALSETLSFGFAEPVTLSRVEVTTGNAASDQTFHAFSRVRKLLLRGPDATATVAVEDRPGLQSVQLEKPLRGKVFGVEVLDSYSAEDPLAPVCLADLIPYAGSTALAGPALRRSLVYQPARVELLGLWFGGPEGAPDRTLTFFLDGTWRYAPEGTTARVKPLAGKWWLKSGQVWLSLPGHAKVEARPKITRRADAGADPSKGKPFATLTFEGAVGELKTSFRERR